MKLIIKGKHDSRALWKHFRYQKKKKKSYSIYEKRGQIPEQVWIDKQPRQRIAEHAAIAETLKKRIGYWYIMSKYANMLIM